VKSLSNLPDRREISRRLAQVSAADTALWGSMNVNQMVCHLDDSYKVALGERKASPATNFIQRTLVKWIALQSPMKWPKGTPTRPEIEQGKGGSRPIDFRQDLASLLTTFDRFCDALPSPCVHHPIFGEMTAAHWMRWGYLHADHHLRQFGR
jgi:hypothetical protein